MMEARGEDQTVEHGSKACDKPSSKVADPARVVGAIRVLVNARGGTRPNPAASLDALVETPGLLG